MTESNPKDDDDLQPLLRRFDEEFGQRQERGPEPIYGEARPIVPPSYQLRLPLGQPRAVWVLLALNVAIYVIPTLLQFVGVRVNGAPINDYLLFLGAKDNEGISLRGEYYRFLTSMFLHGGLLHIGFNAWALYALGPESERIYGTARFLAIYFIGGLAGGVASYVISPYPAVGASGAIFGLIGALAVFYYTSRTLLGDTARQQLGSLITVIMINLFIGFSSGGLIDNWAHLGGLAGGAIAGWLLAPRFALDERLYPPQIVRDGLPWGWAGALGFLALLVFVIMTINPPIR
ncbi:MAG TPA: rhomboid family intramembrane serine protease [Roseiflexaceae bacterium]|nr:rhomboid family intramembrane serine protease [Roseiflexaceae bacterium]